MFEKFAEIKPEVWAVITLLVLLAVVLLLQKKWPARMLVTASLCIALSFLLSYIRLYRMPMGGSITLCSMLPIMLFAYLYGVIPGVLAGTAYGLLQLFQSFEVLHPLSLLLDYPLAYAFLGLAGILGQKGKTDAWRLPIGIIIAATGRLFSHFLSGVLFFAEYAPEGMSPYWYSFTYSATYIYPEAIMCIIIVAIPAISHLFARLKLQAGR